MTRFLFVAALVCANVLASRPARAADFIVTPFVGSTFAPQSTLQSVQAITPAADDKKWVVGASGAWLTTGVLGIEGELAYAPRFFAAGLVSPTQASNVTSLMGNVIFAVPLSVTRESLRPYLSGGLGMLHASANDPTGTLLLDRNLLAYSIGGGAIGFFNTRTGVRFDLRHVRSASTGQNLTTLDAEPRLGFWRFTVGVALRY